MICGDDIQESRVEKCPKCEMDICHLCMKKWLLTDESEPRCFNGDCHISWTRRFLCETLGIKFVNGPLQKRRNEMIVRRVKATNSNVTKEAKQRKKDAKIEADIAIFGRKIKGVDTEIAECRKMYNSLLEAGTNPYDEVMIEISIRRSELEVQREKYMKGQTSYKTEYEKYKAARGGRVTGGGGGGGGGGAKEPTFDAQCPVETCNGFLSKKGLCPICSTQVCKKCQVIIPVSKVGNNGKPFGPNALKIARKKATREHICKKEDIETVKALKNETMACPRCRTRIFKTDGCDQMYCTACEKRGHVTVFSWTTGKIDEGRIHNPHYIEFLRRQKINTREVGDVYCGGLPDVRHVVHKLNSLGFKADTFIAHHRILSEFLEYDVNPLRRKMRDMDIHIETQIQYVAGLINDRTFERRVCTTERRYEMEKELLDIYEVILMVMTETFVNYYNTIDDFSTTQENGRIYIRDVKRFLDNENKCCEELNRIYKYTSVPYGLVLKGIELVRKQKATVSV